VADALVPGEDCEAAGGEGILIGKEAMGPVEFEIAAAPDGGACDLGELEGAIDPAAATPVRGADIPIRVIIEGDEGDRDGEGAEPEGGEVMEIAGAEEGKCAEVWADGIEECVEEGRGGAVAEAGAPLADVEVVGDDVVRPRPVEIDVRRRDWPHHGGHSFPGWAGCQINVVSHGGLARREGEGLGPAFERASRRKEGSRQGAKGQRRKRGRG